MEDFDILNKFDNDKLIDIVKNYKRYGYNDALRNYNHFSFHFHILLVFSIFFDCPSVNHLLTIYY